MHMRAACPLGNILFTLPRYNCPVLNVSLFDAGGQHFAPVARVSD